MKKIVLILLLTFLFTSCTNNQMARQFGGSENIEIPQGFEVVNATWKKADLWILLRNKETNELKFVEYSNFGILQGSITFNPKGNPQLN